MKNDTFIVSLIICYDFYHNDIDIFFVCLFFDENVLNLMLMYDFCSF